MSYRLLKAWFMYTQSLYINSISENKSREYKSKIFKLNWKIGDCIRSCGLWNRFTGIDQ